MARGKRNFNPINIKAKIANFVSILTVAYDYSAWSMRRPFIAVQTLACPQKHLCRAGQQPAPQTPWNPFGLGEGHGTKTTLWSKW